MKAVAITSFGGPDSLAELELPEPRPGPGQISIDVACAGANFAEILYRRGVVDVELPFVPGIEVAGRVRELGPGVGGFEPGDPVAGLTIVDSGGYAEVAVVDARLVAPLPTEITDDELALMAGVPSNTTTAFLVIGETARLREGERVLVHGATGGVGSQLGQVAKLLGAGEVVGTVGDLAKVERARALGYDEVILRSELEAALADGEPFDVVVDPVGGPSREASFAALALGGRLIVMGNASGAEGTTFDANAIWFSGTGVLGFNLAALSGGHPELVEPALRRAIAEVAAGRIEVELNERLPLAEAARAHTRIESGATTGKLVLDVA